MHDLTLPEIDEVKYYNWLATKMRNYIIHIMRHKEYKPRYYTPAKGKEILAHHVARYFGVEHCRML